MIIATPPAARSLPRITDALSSTDSSEHSAAPWPALNSGIDSSTMTAAHTASIAPPPRFPSASAPALSASSSAVR